MRIKLVALDIDGTLLNSRGELPAENARAIEEVLQLGVKIILVTGRRMGTARKIANRLGLNFPMIVHNGALIKAPDDSQRIRAQFIDLVIAARILQATESYLEYLILHCDKESDGLQVIHPLCRNNTLMQGYLAHFPDRVRECSNLVEVLDRDLIQLMFGGDLSVVQKIEKFLIDSRLISQAKMTKTYYPQKELGIIDLLGEGCSKGLALEYLASYYGISPEEILAIGDNHNDLEMLEYSGTSIVMGNCVEELKQRGFHETVTNNEAGVAVALRRFVV